MASSRGIADACVERQDRAESAGQGREAAAEGSHVRQERCRLASQRYQESWSSFRAAESRMLQLHEKDDGACLVLRQLQHAEKMVCERGMEWILAEGKAAVSSRIDAMTADVAAAAALLRSLRISAEKDNSALEAAVRSAPGFAGLVRCVAPIVVGKADLLAEWLGMQRKQEQTDCFDMLLLDDAPHLSMSELACSLLRLHVSSLLRYPLEVPS